MLPLFVCQWLCACFYRYSPSYLGPTVPVRTTIRPVRDTTRILSLPYEGRVAAQNSDIIFVRREGNRMQEAE